jgi:hypothetical protein
LEANGYKLGWCGHSDNETVLACFDEWEIETIVKISWYFALPHGTNKPVN